MNKNTIRFFKGTGALILFCLLSMACNSDFPNILKEYTEQPNYNTGDSKVLLVLVDGINGEALQRIDPPFLKKMSRNSLYTYSALVDYVDGPLTQERAWANIFLGVDAKKHFVEDDLSVLDDNFAYYSFIERIKELNENVIINSHTTESRIRDYFVKKSDKVNFASNDLEVFNGAKADIENTNTDLVIAHFSEVDKIGEETDYDGDQEKYKQAMRIFDRYLEQLLVAIEGRETYGEEDWLVIVASTKGGSERIRPGDNTLYGEIDRNTFVYFYSPKFARKYMTKPTSENMPFVGNALNFQYALKNQAVLESNPTIGNLNTNKSYTISFFYKSYKIGQSNWAAVLGKRGRSDGGEGWAFFHSDNGIHFSSNFGESNNRYVNIVDGEWHVITAVLDREDKTVLTYIDGVAGDKGEINNNNPANEFPLTIGWIQSYGADNTDYLICNFQIFEAAFTEDEVKEMTGLSTVDDAHPHYESLLGYWPGFGDVGLNQLKDLSGNGYHMTLKGEILWNSFSDVVSFIRPDVSTYFYSSVPNSVDISFFIYQWFGVIPSKSWVLDGKSWTPNYIVNND